MHAGLQLGLNRRGVVVSPVRFFDSDKPVWGVPSSVAKELVKAGKEWKIIFAGYKGNLGATMEAEIKDIGLSNEIKFLGLRTDMPLLMSAADVLLFPSLWEGLGMVAVEAQAAGLRIVAADKLPDEAFVIKELVEKKSLSSTPANWADTIIKFTSENTHREGYQDQIEKSGFSIDNSILRLLKLYDTSF